MLSEVQYLESGFMGPCYWNFYDREIIIKDEQSYLEFGDTIRLEIYNLDCPAIPLPELDFDNYFLAGKFTHGGGCSVTYEREIIADDENQKLIYKIDADYTGFCKMLITNMNWVLIPRTYSEYSIEFRVE